MILLSLPHCFSQSCYFNLLALKSSLMSLKLGRTQSKKWKYSCRDSLFRALFIFSVAFNLASSHWWWKKATAHPTTYTSAWKLGITRASMSEMVSAFYEAQHDRSPAGHLSVDLTPSWFSPSWCCTHLMQKCPHVLHGGVGMCERLDHSCIQPFCWGYVCEKLPVLIRKYLSQFRKMGLDRFGNIVDKGRMMQSVFTVPMSIDSSTNTLNFFFLIISK